MNTHVRATGLKIARNLKSYRTERTEDRDPAIDANINVNNRFREREREIHELLQLLKRIDITVVDEGLELPGNLRRGLSHGFPLWFPFHDWKLLYPDSDPRTPEDTRTRMGRRKSKGNICSELGRARQRGRYDILLAENWFLWHYSPHFFSLRAEENT